MCRHVTYIEPAVTRLALLYTDAESNGRIAAVLISDSRTWCWTAMVPSSIKRRLLYRATQIVAYELLAAIMGLLIFDPIVGLNVRVLHFIDAQAALNIIVKGASRQSDLNALAGYLWLTLCKRQVKYWARHVPSSANLADGPSRERFDEMTKLSAEFVRAPPPDLRVAFDLFQAPHVPEHFAW